MKSSDDDIVWSDHSLTIRDVVYGTMPTVVRVAEGFYGGNEAESFSRGDLLKLDFVKSIQKVCATIISSWSQAILEDVTGYMQPDKEIVIPLGYKGKVVITRPPTECKVYVTVAELMHDFPRFVRVEQPFVVTSNNTAIQIKAGTKLELDRYLPTQGLIAKYENKTVVINHSIRSRFVPLPDDTEYTLTEVVDRLPLPQFVTFVEEEFKKVLTTDLLEAVDNVQSFTGCVKINRVFREEVVVGHHKPQIPECLKKEYSKYVRRSVVLLPLSRDAVNEIEVNIPIYSEPDEYELLVISNFSKKSLNEDIIDGSLYLEFAKNPRSFHVIEEEEVPLNEEPEEPPALPPPIPPRPKKHSKDDSKPKVTTKVCVPRPESEELDYEVVAEPQKPPNTVPRSIQQNRETHKHITSQKVKIETPQTSEELDGPLLIYEVPDDESDSYIQLTQSSKSKLHVPMTVYKKLKSVQSELKAKITSKGHSSKPHQLNITSSVSPSPSYDVKSMPIPSPTSPTSIGKSKHILSPTSPAPIGKSKPIPSPTSPTSIGRSMPIPSPTSPAPISSTSHVKSKPDPVPTIPPPRPKPKPHQSQTKDRSKSTAKGQETSRPLYINTDDTKAPRPKHTVAKKVQRDEKQTVKLDEKDKIDDDDDEDQSNYDYPDMSLITNLPPLPPIANLPPLPKSQVRPVVRVQPSTRVVPTTSMGVSQMSVKELVLCLNQCALPQLAKLCDENTIDGKFLFDLNEHNLRDKPYSLSDIEVAKVKKMKEGWRPKIY